MEALPLRTGRTNCVTNMQRDMTEQTLAIIASMMQQAAHDATLYCAEAKRTVIMPRDIELALKRLVLPGSAYWTRDDLPEEARQIRQRLFADTDASSEESTPARLDPKMVGNAATRRVSRRSCGRSWQSRNGM